MRLFVLIFVFSNLAFADGWDDPQECIQLASKLVAQYPVTVEKIYATPRHVGDDDHIMGYYMHIAVRECPRGYIVGTCHTNIGHARIHKLATQYDCTVPGLKSWWKLF